MSFRLFTPFRQLFFQPAVVYRVDSNARISVITLALRVPIASHTMDSQLLLCNSVPAPADLRGLAQIPQVAQHATIANL